MKRMKCLNHNLYHIPSENSETPTESPTTSVTVRPSIYQAEVIIATVEGAETFYLYMK
jgi:hypothetical protein